VKAISSLGVRSPCPVSKGQLISKCILGVVIVWKGKLEAAIFFCCLKI
jgi:hypothetical protein